MRSKGECSPADMRIGDWSIGNRIDKGGNVNVRHRDGSKDVLKLLGNLNEEARACFRNKLKASHQIGHGGV